MKIARKKEEQGTEFKNSLIYAKGEQMFKNVTVETTRTVAHVAHHMKELR
jgi:hypothetical protein